MDDQVGLPQPEKLTDWAKEPTVMLLKSDLEAAQPAHEVHVQNIDRWNALRNVTGSYRPKKIKNRSQVQPKLIRRQAEWRYSALSEPFLSSKRLFTADPRTAEDKPGADQSQLLLNFQFDTKIDKVGFIDHYVRTGVDEGTIVVRTGWHRETRDRQVEVPVWEHLEIRTPEEQAQLEQAIQFRQQNPRGFKEQLPEELQAAVEYFLETGVATIAVKVGVELVREEEVLENRPTAEVVPSKNVIFDSSCGSDYDRAKFAIYSFETSKAELLKEGDRYKNIQAVNWDSATILAQPDHETKTPDSYLLRDNLRKPVVAHEYWGYYDVHGTEELTPIVATWVGDVMIRMEENPFPDKKIPFVVVPYLPVRDQLAGEPDAEILEDNQAIVGAVMRGMIDLLGRSANSQLGMPKGYLDTVNRRRFQSGLDYEYNPGQFHPAQAVHQHTYPELPQSGLTMLGLQNAEAESMSGVKAFHGGISGEAYGEVAAGIKGMLDASGKREMNILRRLANGIAKVGAKIAAMNAVFLSEEETVRVTNKEFVKVRREDLKGNFDWIVDIATAEVDQAKAQDLGFMLQTMGPDMDPGLAKEILAEIAELKRMPHLAERIRNYQPQPSPMEQIELQTKQLEMRKIMKEIEKIESEIQKNLAEAQKKSSETDLNNLEFLEEESGTKHERDLQKQARQASALQDLEITKAFLTPKKPEEREPDIEAAVGYNELSDPTRVVRRF